MRMDSMEIDDNTYVTNNLIMEDNISKGFQRRKQPSRCMTVCLGLLCAGLLAGNIGQIIYYEIISHHMSADPTQANYSTPTQDRLQSGCDAVAAEKTLLEARLNNLTKEKDQLQQSYSSSTTERNEFNASFINLKNEWDQLQSSYNRNYSSLKRDMDQLQRSYNTLNISKNQLLLSYSSLWKEKEQLQAIYKTLQKEKEQLQIKHSSLAADRDQLAKKINKVRKKPCQTGWRKFDISCYFFSNLKKNWTLARKDCISKGADLVIIDSTDEQEFLIGFLTVEQNAWIGLTDSLEEGTWMWVDGTPVTTTYWQPGQPNSYNGNQDCGELVPRKKVGEWNDDGCFAEQEWICEK